MKRKWFRLHMSNMIQKVIRTGSHSLAVIIPAPFIHALGVKKGDNVEVSTHIDNGYVNIKFVGTLQLKLPSSDKK